jgi:site-specific DNA recombinase
MKIADLYIRVSTDEQADKGYSQRNQDEMLHKYCQLHVIQVRDVIYEDHSAKTFNRPGWTKMLTKFKKAKGKANPDYILLPNGTGSAAIPAMRIK